MNWSQFRNDPRAIQMWPCCQKIHFSKWVIITRYFSTNPDWVDHVDLIKCGHESQNNRGAQQLQWGLKRSDSCSLTQILCHRKTSWLWVLCANGHLSGLNYTLAFVVLQNNRLKNPGITSRFKFLQTTQHDADQSHCPATVRLSNLPGQGWTGQFFFPFCTLYSQNMHLRVQNYTDF